MGNRGRKRKGRRRGGRGQKRGEGRRGRGRGREERGEGRKRGPHPCSLPSPHLGKFFMPLFTEHI